MNSRLRLTLKEHETVRNIKHFVKRSMLACVLAIVLITPLLTARVAEAAPALTCPGWNLIASPSPGGSNFLRGVAAVSANNVWAVGYSFTGLNGDQTLIERWNGTIWGAVTSPNPGSDSNDLFSVAAVSATDVWAVGGFSDGSNTRALIEHWNGTSWNVVSSPNIGSDAFLSGVAAVSTTDVWVVGDYTLSPSSSERTLIEHWNGSQWSIVTSPNPGSSDNTLSSVAAVSASDVWAVGSSFYGSSLTYQTIIEHWNGSQWSIVTSPNVGPNALLSSVAAISTSNVWAVGNSTTSSYITQTLIEHWNGTTWSAVTSPNPGSNYNALSGVATISANNVWAVGEWQTPSQPERTLIEHWNGTSWNVVEGATVGRGNKALYGVARVPGTRQLWAVGRWLPAHTQGNKTLTEFHC